MLSCVNNFGNFSGHQPALQQLQEYIYLHFLYLILVAGILDKMNLSTWEEFYHEDIVFNEIMFRAKFWVKLLQEKGQLQTNYEEPWSC